MSIILNIGFLNPQMCGNCQLTGSALDELKMNIFSEDTLSKQLCLNGLALKINFFFQEWKIGVSVVYTGGKNGANS